MAIGHVDTTAPAGAEVEGRQMESGSQGVARRGQGTRRLGGCVRGKGAASRGKSVDLGKSLCHDTDSFRRSGGRDCEHPAMIQDFSLTAGAWAVACGACYLLK